MHKFKIIEDRELTRIQQVAESIRRDIEKGLLQRNEQLPSINEFSSEYKVARDTIEKAYGLLKKQGYINSFAGKGYFVVGKKDKKLKVLLVFNKLSTYKKMVYDSFIETLGKHANVDLQIHHYDPHLLKEIIENALGKYHYYVIMPHFYLTAKTEEYLKIFEMIPEQELVILDKQIKGLKKNCIEVYQDFQNDIYSALADAKDLLLKYDRIAVVLKKEGHHPREIIKGVRQFCLEFNKELEVLSSAETIALNKGTVYIETTESDLALLIKKARQSKMIPGKSIGIISFNETVLKELLDVTVITTDFEAMGRTAAKCILDNNCRKIRNPFYMIRRKTL
ncbi:GntR family transcriptional regulator [Lacibacter sediminis]|uniref:GntR family transcriptional regulator n=1 Tax=Lacibacter sediminis TaxID=2760713 RepID=A0A7G5XDA4_9BACT|nr:winged helix-turn-helix domain-containing protein [Lacibacter sediminis]QNA43457.1 GntR family transcriptional regulator [Lacibacter sediminis]